MIIRRLDPVADEALLRSVYGWDAHAPSWYKDSDGVCRPSLARYMKFTRNQDQVDIGIFTDELIGLVTFDHKLNGIAEVRFSAKRGAPLETLTKAAYQLRHQFFSIGMTAGVVWVAKKNRHVIRLCETIGFVRDVTMYRGVYRRKIERPIQWLRMITTREQWLSELTT